MGWPHGHWLLREVASGHPLIQISIGQKLKVSVFLKGVFRCGRGILFGCQSTRMPRSLGGGVSRSDGPLPWSVLKNRGRGVLRITSKEKWVFFWGICKWENSLKLFFCFANFSFSVFLFVCLSGILTQDCELFNSFVDFLSKFTFDPKSGNCYYSWIIFEAFRCLFFCLEIFNVYEFSGISICKHRLLKRSTIRIKK